MTRRTRCWSTVRPELKSRTLVIRSWNGGFFSNFNGVLNNLHYRFGREGIEAAVVDWRIDAEQKHFAYGAPDDGNIWLRFFEPLPFESFPPDEIEVRTYADFGMTGRNAYGMYKLDRSWRRDYHSLYRRFIRVKPAILDRVDALDRARMSGRYCVGVHYRNPAHAGECPDPIPAAEAFITRCRRLLPKDRPWSVILATDVEPAVAPFQRAFGDALVLQSGVMRAPTLASGQLHHGHQAPSTLLGEQVLIDCLLLARCDVLLHVTSNLATAVGYINPQLRMNYSETPMQAAANHIDLLLQRFRINRHWQ
jgi:hypothetical protein